MPEPLFAEQINLAVPPGFPTRVREAARQEGQTASKFIRQAIRAQLRRSEPEQVAAGDRCQPPHKSPAKSGAQPWWQPPS